MAFDAVVSGLILNFVPEPDGALSEMARVVRLGGVLAAYVWDYAEGMQMMRHFWDAAVALDPRASEMDEGRRFTLCNPEPLSDLFRTAELKKVEVRAIDVPTVFRDFDDYWSPFLGGQGPAPGYAMSLSQERGGRLFASAFGAACPPTRKGSTTSSPALGPCEALSRDTHLL